MTGLGTAGDRDRLLWPWMVVAGVAVLAAALLTLLVVRPGAEPARTVTLVTEVGEWSLPTDDWTTRKTEVLDQALESVHPGLNVSTATYVRDDGTELSVGTMVTEDGDDIDRVVPGIEGSVYGLVLARLPQTSEEADPGPLGGTMTCGTVILRRGARLACAWHDRTTAGALSVRVPTDADLDIDLAGLTRELRSAVTQER